MHVLRNEYPHLLSLRSEDSTQLEIGLEVEKEHKNIWDLFENYLSQRDLDMPITEEKFYELIAQVHINEFKDYYTKLEKMEKSAMIVSDDELLNIFKSAGFIKPTNYLGLPIDQLVKMYPNLLSKEAQIISVAASALIKKLMKISIRDGLDSQQALQQARNKVVSEELDSLVNKVYEYKERGQEITLLEFVNV